MNFRYALAVHAQGRNAGKSVKGWTVAAASWLAIAPALAQSGGMEIQAASCVQPSVTMAERPACLERLAVAASKAMVDKTNAFLAIASISCADNVYVEWQETLDALAAIWRVANTQTGSGAENARIQRLKRSIEMDILESRFTGADAALRNGGRLCRKYSDAEYRRVLNAYRDPAFGFARDRARVGIDDVRALPPIPD